ncbi:hypothetical protein [Hyalangium gracile]|uniref:hypothetical protein n=1 Tax=Hyalangium gracile TaxID=394092 RepID=UPI001CCD0D83|nr:hypothetical protein [Hyalangium gracile]
MPKTNRSCQQHTLAHGPVAQVQSCGDCGSISIHLGPMSMRLDAEALRSLWMTLGEAVEQLDRDHPSTFTRAMAGLSRGDA